MVVAIVGSRQIDWVDWGELLSKIPKKCNKIISGGAVGVDQWAHQVAEYFDLPLMVVQPNYKKYGKRAPLIRNEIIAQTSDHLIAVWDGRSNGTRHILLCAQRLGKPLDILIPSLYKQDPNYYLGTLK